MSLATRQVAIATVIEAIKRRQLLSHHRVSYPIYVIGQLFWIGNEQFSGPAVLTPDALFLLKGAHKQRVTLTSANDLAPTPTPLLEMKHMDVPSILVEENAWPVPPSPECDVAILMRDQLRLVRPGAGGEVEFLSAVAPVRVECTDPTAAQRHLHGTGWIRSAPPSETPPVVATQAKAPADYRPLIVGLVCAAVVGVVMLITQLDAITPTAGMLLCIPLLAIAVMATLRLLAPPRTRREEDDEA